MIHSMTAFGRDRSESTGGTLTWELRTVNHRYLDISLRLPEELRQVETEVRKRTGTVLGRGKFDGSLKYQRDDSATEISVDADVVDRLMAVVAQVAEKVGDAAPMSVVDIL